MRKKIAKQFLTGQRQIMLYVNCELFSIQNIPVFKNPVSVLFFVKIFTENLTLCQTLGIYDKKDIVPPSEGLIV